MSTVRGMLQRAGQAAFRAVFWFNVAVMAVSLAMSVVVLVLFPEGRLFAISLGLFAVASIMHLWKQARTRAAPRDDSKDEES